MSSSNGGRFSHTEYGLGVVRSEPFNFSGPEWEGLTWIMLHNRPIYWQSHQGWDNIRYSFNTVPAPGTALLVAGGLDFLAITRRRRHALQQARLSLS